MTIFRAPTGSLFIIIHGSIESKPKDDSMGISILKGGVNHELGRILIIFPSYGSLYYLWIMGAVATEARLFRAVAF